MKSAFAALATLLIAGNAVASRMTVSVLGAGTATGNGTCVSSPAGRKGYGVTVSAQVAQTVPPLTTEQQTETWVSTQNGIGILVHWEPTKPGERAPAQVRLHLVLSQSGDATASISGMINGNSVGAHGDGAYAYVSGGTGVPHAHSPQGGGLRVKATNVVASFSAVGDGTYVAAFNTLGPTVHADASTGVKTAPATLTGKGVAKFTVTIAVAGLIYGT